MINSSNLLNSANKEIISLLEYANKSLDSIDTKQKDLSNLIDQIEKNIEEYRDKPKKIEENCNYAANLNIDLKQDELENIMSQTRQLAATINVNTIESDTSSSQAKINQYLTSIDQVNALLPDFLSRFNQTTQTFETVSNKTESVETNLAELEKNNQNFIGNLKAVKFY